MVIVWGWWILLLQHMFNHIIYCVKPKVTIMIKKLLPINHIIDCILTMSRNFGIIFGKKNWTSSSQAAASQRPSAGDRSPNSCRQWPGWLTKWPTPTMGLLRDMIGERGFITVYKYVYIYTYIGILYIICLYMHRMYVCMYIYIYSFIYIYTYTHTQKYLDSVYVYACVFVYVHVYMYMYMYTYMYIYMYMYLYMYI